MYKIVGTLLNKVLQALQNDRNVTHVALVCLDDYGFI
jgi:hypothetical protein